MAAAAVLEPPFEEWRSGLAKKTSFETVCQALSRSAEALADLQCRPLLARAHTLLRSRYTTRPYWVAGRNLFRAALEQAGSDAAFRQQLQLYIDECDEFLGDAAGASQDAAGNGAGSAGLRRSNFLFEGQLSNQESIAAAASHTDAGLLHLFNGPLAEQLAAAMQAAQPQQQDVAPGAEGPTPADGQQAQEAAAPQAEAEAGQQVEEQQGSQQQQQGLRLSPQEMEALQRELDAIAVQVMEETGGAAAAQRRAPPASKTVVATLPREHLTASRLRELGGADVRCPVCMDELSEGAEVQVLPCRHVFHPPCLAPWLQDNNSCPTCRHELPTDDWRYEDRKERQRLEEEDRRGAANAVSHNEFLYI